MYEKVILLGTEVTAYVPPRNLWESVYGFTNVPVGHVVGQLSDDAPFRIFKLSMNLLNKTKTYLIGPMEYSKGHGRSWRKDITPKLREMGIKVMDPYHKNFINAPQEDEETISTLKLMMEEGKYADVNTHMKAVRGFDLACVDRSDFIIGYINPKVPTFGTMEELQLSVSLKRPIFLVIEGGVEKTPLWIMGMLKPKYLYNSFDEALEVLAGLDAGEIPIDNNKWKLFEKDYR